MALSTTFSFQFCLICILSGLASSLRKTNIRFCRSNGRSYPICAAFVSFYPVPCMTLANFSSVGSEALGNVFPGVLRPYGMVKLGPDLARDEVNAYAGYLPDGDFTGFSMMHLSGAGGVPMYGVVSQLPILGPIANPLDGRVGRAIPDVAEVGYYGARTSDDVLVELAATEHAAMYQYTFSQDQGGQNNIVVDLSHRLPSFRGFGLEQTFEGGNMNINSEGQYEGSATYSNGYNMAPPWTIYFCTLDPPGWLNLLILTAT